MFRPDLAPQAVPIPGGGLCLVFDDILLEPERWRSRAAEFAAQFEPPRHNAYPGRELRLPDTVTAALLGTVLPSLRHHFGISRIVDAYCRLSMVTLAPAQLTPAQSLCHRDRLQAMPGMLPLASVLYLFDDPSLGGTLFFRSLLEQAPLTQLLVDSNRMEAESFFQRYRLSRGYMTDSNAYFEKVLAVPARYNRMIVYPGMKFHSGDIGRPGALTDDPLTGRLTFNGFFTGTMD